MIEENIAFLKKVPNTERGKLSESRVWELAFKHIF